MKLAILTALYRDALKWFYSVKEPMGDKPYGLYKQAVDDHVSLWAAAWERALAKKGFEVVTFPLNDKSLLAAWALENGVQSGSPELVLIEMMRRFRPEVLWYDSVNAQLLRSLKEALPSLRLIISWSGSAVVAFDVFRESDAVLTCAPETVTRLSADGFVVHHMHHAFDPHWTRDISAGAKLYDVTFVGQIVRGASFHAERERMLRRLADEIDLTLFSATHNLGPRDVLRAFAIQIVYSVLLPIKKLGLSSVFACQGGLRKVVDLQGFPPFPYNRILKRIARPPVFGTAMLTRLKESRIVLNIHADTSPRFASNMRLFETTGVGSLLLTELRENITELFRPDEEVVTYKNVDECVEKARWLLSHPEECAEIAERGMKRTLKDHTFDQRADIFCDIVRKQTNG